MNFIGTFRWAAAFLALIPLPASAQDPIGTDLRYSAGMFDRQNNVTDKIPLALRARASGELGTGRLYLGGRFVGTHISERSNTAGKFPILSRFPDTHTSGRSDTYDVINEISLGATLTLPLLTAYAQAEYSELIFPGQSDVQMRRYWLAVGDLHQSPFYAAVGRKTVNFGDFASYAPFTHTHSTHYFRAQTRDPLFEFGYISDRTQIAVSLIREHRGLRVINSRSNDGGYGNFAINLRHRLDLSGDKRLRLGAGFLRGTIYDSAIAHHPPNSGTNRIWNGAWDVNATFSSSRLDVMAEFTQTQHAWPATGHRVSAMALQGRYRSQIFSRPATYSLAASRGTQGASGTEWEKMDQLVLGLEVAATPNLSLGAEYVFNEGFVPLLMPTVVADAGVRSHTLIVGAKLTF